MIWLPDDLEPAAASVREQLTSCIFENRETTSINIILVVSEVAWLSDRLAGRYSWESLNESCSVDSKDTGEIIILPGE